ncbi:MAG TPA: hemolysin family protein [Acidimicrobiales bacterium]|nr:hemolysin family protein [Acidimicrobiales bacterium]
MTVTPVDVWILVAIGALLLLSALLASAETALVRVPRSRAETLADEGRRGAKALVELLGRPEQHVTTVLFLLLTCQLVQATLVGIVADRLFGVVGMVVATALDVVVVFVLAETAPKTWAVLNPERAALAAARPVRALALFPPLRGATRGLIGLTNLVLPGPGLKQGPYVSSEEELLAVAELGVEEGVIEEGERALIESIIEFGDTIVREVMVPRPDMVTVSSGFRVADVMEVVLLNGYSRLPVCGVDIDDVVGLAYAKDLMAAERDGKEDVAVAEFVRTARFVPETKRVPELLREMQRDKFHMAIVVDEYGGTAGLVTLEDIIEELVGEIVDEFDVDDPIVEPLPGGGIRVDGRVALDEVNDLLRARLPEGDWDTIGGLVYDQVGHVPVEGESVELAGWRLTAQRIQGRRIGRVSITPAPGTGGEPPPVASGGASPRSGGHDGSGANGSGTRPAAGRQRRSDDRGQVAGIEALPFGLLVFVVGALLVVNAWAVIDAKLATDAAARQATRTYVEADAGTHGSADAEAAANRAGLAALAAHGRDPAQATIGLTGLEGVGGQTGFSRCARATFRVEYHVPALTIPWVGGFGDGFDVTSTHSELVDPFRSGVPGSAAACR